MSYNDELQSNNNELVEILRTVNALPDAGGGSGESVETDFTLVGEALLEADADVIKISLSKPCKHIIIAYKPFGSDTVTSTTTSSPYCYLNPDVWKTTSNSYFGSFRLEAHKFDGNKAKYSTQFIEYKVAVPTALISRGWCNTSYLIDDNYPLDFGFPSAVKAKTDTFERCKPFDSYYIESILLQVWNVAWGAGTHIWVYGG